MEPSETRSPKYRVLALDEATRALMLERQENSKTSMLAPHLRYLVECVEKNRTLVTVANRLFTLRKANGYKGDSYILMPADGSNVPMARFSLSDIKLRIEHASESTY